jgi:quinol monooxygenase YgiN
MQRRTFLQSAAVSGIAAQPAAKAIAAGSPGPVAFTIEIRVKPGAAAEFLELLHPVLDAMRHEASFINAVLHRDPEDPTRFFLYETWADLDDVVQVQLHRPYRQAYTERLPALLAAERVIGVWQPIRIDPARCSPD